jgi:hypothetical protein
MRTLFEHWKRKLPEGERRVLEVLVAAYPATGYKRSSRDAYLQRLGARRLVEVDGSEVKASDHLFD